MKIPILGPADAPHGKALCNLVFLQLGKDRQYSNHGPAKGSGGVKILVNGNKVHILGQETILNQHEGIFLAPGQAVKLVDNNRVYQYFADVLEHLL